MVLCVMSGKKDVADQIEDEEQVLGLKGDKEDEDPDRGAQEEKDGGMEMQVAVSLHIAHRSRCRWQIARCHGHERHR